MKKKVLLVLLIVLLLCGCGKNSTSKSKKKAKTGETGRIYELVSLNDKNINMFNTIVPEGWTATISSENLVNSTHPFVETVILTNPEKTASIAIISQHSYVENNKYNEGVNTDYYTTYLHQMDAATYLDYFMSGMDSNATFVKNGKVDDKIAKDVKSLQKIRVELAKQDANKIDTKTYGVSISIGDEGSTVAKREYETGDAYYEATTSVLAISTNLEAQLSALLNSRAVTWYMPYVIVYSADTMEDFENYYDDYNFIVANSAFTVDYYAMIEYVSSAIVNAYTSYYAEKSKAALQAMNDYIDSNYTSTSSQSTNDKVMEMWDDVIKEVDKYELEDGTTLKTSIHNETVAQNGNEIYIGSKAGIPIGFEEVHKGY